MKEIPFVISCPRCGSKINGNLEIESRYRKTNKIDELVLQRIKELAGTKPDGEVAREVGVSLSLIYNFRKENNIKRYYKIEDESQWKKIDVMFNEYTDTEISRISGILYQDVRKRRKFLDIELPEKFDRREVIRKIFILKKQGFNQQDIANAVRLTRQRIEQILTTKNESDYLPQDNASSKTV